MSPFNTAHDSPRNILTIATGKKLYVDIAANLARSFWLWNAGTNITFYLATDQPQYIPADLKAFVKIILIQPGELGEGFSPKLHLDKLAPAGQTLFIDSDCLVFGKLDFVFEIFKGHAVSVIGNYISKGEWFGDIQKICVQYNVPHLPKFNGGIYYLENGPVAKEVYSTAREFEKIYDEIGFVRLRNRPNDEVLMALAMQMHGQAPVIDDGTIMSDPQSCPGGYKMDIVSGERWLVNPPAPNPRHQAWYPFEKVSPVIVHFLGYYTSHYPYKREVYRLIKKMANKLNWVTEVVTLVKIEYPERFKVKLKNALRPVYHFFFHVRKIKQSERL
ncbi:MAG: hypothetical protein JWP94_1123 [Mucilaginibacter sp.]|nr:hypothetical protein [Mucilaginibacter sp.]